MTEPINEEFDLGKVVSDFVTLGAYFGTTISGYGSSLEQLARSQSATSLDLVNFLADRAREIQVSAESARVAAANAGNEARAAAYTAVRDFLADEHQKLTSTILNEETRLAQFSQRINARLAGLGSYLGPYIGPAFDIASVVDAIRQGDGNAAGKAVLSMGMAWLFAAGATALLFAAGVPATITAIGGGTMASAKSTQVTSSCGAHAASAGVAPRTSIAPARGACSRNTASSRALGTSGVPSICHHVAARLFQYAAARESAPRSGRMARGSIIAFL